MVYTFGQFVVGGNLIVGIVIFLIITIVQFLVITKGSERVAEVSARFSLDVMPGKQMSIDGDMRAGVIDMDEARERRSQVEKESQMFGSMDGAMKFVKGDAIAGLVIILVNILGGIAIGVSQRGMSAADALNLYSILTVGDGMVSQVPALLIAITSGIIVTRVSSENSSDLGSDIGEQIVAQPRAIFIGGVLLVLFGLIPGFPTITFFILAALMTAGGYWLIRQNKQSGEKQPSDINILINQGAGAPAIKKKNSAPLKSDKLERQEEFALTVPLLIDLDIKLKEQLEAVAFNEELMRVRRVLYLDLGVPFPGIYLRFNDGMADGEYIFELQEVPVTRGILKAGKLLVQENEKQLDLLAIPYEKGEMLLTGKRALWVEEQYLERLVRSNLSVLTMSQVLTWHLSFVLKEYAADFIGIQETRYLLEKMESYYSELVKEVQHLLPLYRITEVLQRLVSENISIRNMRTILEALIEWGQKEKDIVQLTEYIRGSLKRYICYKYASGNNFLPAYLFDQQLEEIVRDSIRQTNAGSYLALEPTVSEKLIENVRSTVGNIQKLANKPVVIVSMDIRRYVRKLLENEFSELPILSYQELTNKINIQPLGKISL
ncbi:MAG: type III secretion system export apparatus subunit SctV [Arsenophonus sp.]|nr:type III secretion system export apparatus subunit SctV [Arsenophonus sp.]MDR5615004.1 type III secretion system export apparatus subunit SctV [Arsenophonus sp.]